MQRSSSARPRSATLPTLESDAGPPPAVPHGAEVVVQASAPPSLAYPCSEPALVANAPEQPFAVSAP
jgi:hypothetical protein